MIKEIIFDMDMTIAALYDVPNWLEMLRAYDPTPMKWLSLCGIWPSLRMSFKNYRLWEL